MKQWGLLLTSCLLSLNGYAAFVDLKLSERSVHIGRFKEEYLNRDESAGQAAMKDPKILADQIVMIYFDIVRQQNKIKDPRTFMEKFDKEIKQIDKTYAPQIRSYIEKIAAKYNAKIHKEGSTKIYSIENGIGFFRDIYAFEGVKDPMLQAMVRALFSTIERHRSLAAPLEKIVSSIKERPMAATYLLSTEEYTESDLKMLVEIVKGTDYHYEKVGNTWIFGGGFAYLITKDLLKKGIALTDSILKAKFDKIVRYHKNFTVPVTHDYQQGAAAYFSPTSESMTFVIPSRGDLNSYTHEMTHSRFNKFTATLDKWTKQKGYSVPYQIDGPNLGGLAALFATHGGLFNLLNEVNSWRIGESFDGKGADADIIKTLVAAYGPQAGYESTEILEKVWTPAKLGGKSVPYLIYSEIKEFNKMTNDQLVLMGYEGVVEKDLVKKMNFLIMYAAGRFKGTEQESDAHFVLEEIANHSEEKAVRQHLAFIDEKYKTAETETENNKKDLSKSTFEEVFTEFVNNGSTDAKDILISKFIKQIGLQHIDGLISRAALPKTETFQHEGLEVLENVLANANIPKTIEREKGLQIRGPIQSKLLKAIDLSLSSRLYDGSVASKKTDLLNFISAQFHPDELPLTYTQTLDLLKNPKDRSTADLWLARLFFVPSSDLTDGSEILWGEKLIKDLKGSEVSKGIREAMGWFYKDSMSGFISHDSYGQWSSSLLTKKTRVKLAREMKKLSPRQHEALQIASENLWTLSQDNDPQVRTSALFAILANAMYLSQVEGHMMHDLNSKGQKYSAATAFLLDIAPEMVPKAAILYAHEKAKAASAVRTCGGLWLVH